MKNKNKNAIEDVISLFESNNLKMLGEYVNSRSKILCIDSDGYKVVISYDNLRRGRTPQRFEVNNPYTLENIKHYIISNNRDVELLSDSYISSVEKMEFICLKHNEVFEMSCTRFISGHSCPICGGTKKLEYKDACELFSKNGFTLLDKEYKRNSTKMKCIDSEGYLYSVRYADLNAGDIPLKFGKSNKYTIENIKKYIDLNREKVKLVESQVYKNAHCKLKFECLIHGEVFEMNWNSFKSGKGCPTCAREINSDKLRLTLDDIKQRIIDMGRDESVELLSTKYVNTGTKLKFKCLIHNEIFEMNWGNFSGGKGCPICGREIGHGVGGYNLTLAERYKDKYLTENMNLYIIKCSNDLELFYKIGLTKNSLDARFTCKTVMPYNIEEIVFISGNKYEMIYLESELHDIHKDVCYNPDIYFGGYTECFIRIYTKKIENTINKYKLSEVN